MMKAMILYQRIKPKLRYLMRNCVAVACVYLLIVSLSNYRTMPSHYVVVSGQRDAMEASLIESEFISAMQQDNWIHRQSALCNVKISISRQSLQVIANVSGNLQCLVYATNRLLNVVRNSQLAVIPVFSGINHYSHDVPTTVARSDHRNSDADSYFPRISSYPQVLTVLLAWDTLTKRKWNDVEMPAKTYYKSAAPKSVCNLTKTSPECMDILNSSRDSSSTFKSKEPEFSLQGAKSTIYPLSVHLVHNAMITYDGRVYSGSLDIIPIQCHMEYNITRHTIWQYFLPIFLTESHYSEVFTIAQYWGGGYFHAHIEDFPRLAPYLDFLAANPQIKIHIIKYFPTLDTLGLSADRFVTGRIKADIVYVPQGGGCGWTHPIGGQILSHKYSTYITSVFPMEHLERRSIVLMERTERRWLAEHDEVKDILVELASQFGLTLEVFSDRDLPGFNDTLKIFHRALLVVGPHGAGFSNLMFSRPGTGVLELLCNPRPNYCYETLAKTLGHVYVGLLSVEETKCGPIHIDNTFFTKAASKLLQQLVPF